MRAFIAQAVAHLIVWLRDGFPLDCWAARTVAQDAIQKGASVRRAIAAGVAAGTSMTNRRHGHGR